jgi:hypothetical protein
MTQPIYSKEKAAVLTEEQTGLKDPRGGLDVLEKR